MIDMDPTHPESRSRRPLNGLYLLGMVLLLAIVVWLVFQWAMAPVLSGSRQHDFGIVSISQKGPAYVTHRFVLENLSGRPVKIKRAVPSCGCTSVEYFDPDVLVDGVVEIPVVMKFKRSARERSKVTLTFEEAPPMTLHVEGIGRLQSPLIIEPLSLRMRPGQSRPVALTIQFWEDGTIQYPVITAPEGMRIEEGRWKKVRAFDPGTNIPGLMRSTMKVTLPQDFTPGETSIRIKLGEGHFTIPVFVPPAIGRGPDVQRERDPSKTFDPLKRMQMQENPEDEVPSGSGTNSSSIPSRR